MNYPVQVGVTGGIGSGKSLICKVFQCLGVPVYDADSRAKNLMTTDGILIDQIKKEFGKLAFHPDGRLDRTFISQAAFREPAKLEKLNSLVHPRVALDYEKWVKENQGAAYLIKEAALIFEAETDKVLDQVVVVSAPEEMRIQRVLDRDPQRSETEIKKIIGNQMKEEEKLALADYVIVNDETLPVLPQVLDLHKQFNSLN